MGASCWVVAAWGATRASLAQMYEEHAHTEDALDPLLLEAPGARRHGARGAATDVGVMTAAGREEHKLAAPLEDRSDHGYIGQV